MSDEQIVIYTARTSQEAHLLKNYLSELRIRATVTNDVLERGSGVDIVGWPTLARVVVGEEDAPRARQIALDFERKAAAARAVSEGQEPEGAAVLAEWPQCPQCHVSRSTRCPICQTAGTEFRPADSGFIGLGELDEAARGPACSCGPDGCTPAEPAAAAEPAESAPDWSASEPDERMLVCPTCDEPFVPEYPRQCEWCGHEFEDGFDVSLPQDPADEVDSRTMLVVVALAALGAGLVAYFTLIVA